MKKLVSICFLLSLPLGLFAQSSDIVTVASSEQGSIAYASKQSSTITTTSDGLKVWSFTVRDDSQSDSDSDPTYWSELTIIPGASNVPSWTSVIRAVALFRSGSKVVDGTIASDQFYFTVDGVNTVDQINDNASATYDLYVTFKAPVTDNQHLDFKITDANIVVAPLEVSSTFATFTAASSTSGSANLITVTADRLAFQTTLVSVYPLTDFSCTVRSTDALGSVDVDATGTVTISKGLGSGTLSTATFSPSLSSGVVSWSDLQLDVEDDSVTLVVTHSGSLTSATSSVFEVTGALLVESFNYSTNDTLTEYGWTQLGATATNPIKTTGASLTLTQYPFSGVGVAVEVGPSGGGQDVYRTFTAQTSGSLYYSFVVRVTSAASSTPTPFIGFGPSSPSGTSDMRSCVFALTNLGNIAFGIAKGPSVSVALSDTIYATETAYLLVVRHDFIADADNDVAYLFIQPTTNAAEPAPDITTSTGSSLDPANLGSIVLRQDASSGYVTIDGIRVSTTWADVTLPVQMINFVAVSSLNEVRLSWNTATEVDNDGFEVERRSVNPQSALNTPQWERLAFIPGAGTSTSERSYSYTDGGLAPGRYAYRIKQIDRSGAYTYYREAEVEIGAAPKEFTLNDAYPNPFNPSTTINFTLGASDRAVLKVYDVLGREITTLFDGMAEAGRVNRVQWNAAGIPSGMYFARLESGGMSAMKKLVLLK